MSDEVNRWSPGEWARSAQAFLGEVRTELRKVTWPTRQETVGGTIGVVVIVAVLTGVLAVVDFGLAQLIKVIVP